MLLLRLACSGAATALPAAPRACAYCPALTGRLSATMVALLLLPARHWLRINSAGHAHVARQLTMEANPDMCKSLQLCGPVLPDAGSPFTPCDAPFARCGSLWTANNGTSAACHSAGPVAAVFSGITEPTSVWCGVDFIFVLLGKLWAEVSRDFVRVRAAVMSYNWMEICSVQHLLRDSSATGCQSVLYDLNIHVSMHDLHPCDPWSLSCRIFGGEGVLCERLRSV